MVRVDLDWSISKDQLLAKISIKILESLWVICYQLKVSDTHELILFFGPKLPIYLKRERLREVNYSYLFGVAKMYHQYTK